MAEDVNLRTSTVLLRLAVTGFGLLGVVWAVLGLVAEVDGAPARRLAERIRDGAAPDLAYLRGFETRHDLDALLATCRGDLARAVSLIRLSQLDAALSGGDMPAVDAAQNRAAETLRAALGCAPLDGDAWLRLAMVEARRTGLTPDVMAMLRLSYWTTPNELSVMRPRIRFASRLYAAGVDELASDLAGDIRDLVLWGRDPDVEALLLSAPERVRPFYEKAIRLVPENRRRRLAPLFEARGFVPHPGTGAAGS